MKRNSARKRIIKKCLIELKNTINVYQNRFRILLKRKTELMRLKYEKCMQSRVFKQPTEFINDHLLKIDSNVKKMEKSISDKMHESKNSFIGKLAKLDSLSPLKTLTRGYCIARAKKWKSNKIGRRIKYR